MFKKAEHDTSLISQMPMRFIFPTEKLALTWAKRAAHWQKCTVFVVKLRSREFEIVKTRPTREHVEVTRWQEVTKIETNGGLTHE